MTESNTILPCDSLAARPAIRDLRASKIREVANAAMGFPDVLSFWFGEPDEVTPDHVRSAAIAELEAGNTFYVQTLGIPALREAVAIYTSRLHRQTGVENIAITSSGTSALMLAVQALVGAGDRVVAVTPLWPNLVEMPKVVGGLVTTVPLDFHAGGWRLDVDALLDALVPGTRALLVNSPNNPTGWVMPRAAQQRVLEHCRRHGIWIIADDVYERISYEARCTPSFLDIANPADRVVSCNSFSKAWLMTGWRLGWIVAPAELMPEIGKLIEYSTTCAPPFVQCAGIAALEQGETTIARTVERLRHSRDHLSELLAGITGVHLAAPPLGAMYTFFRIDSVADSLDFCKRLVVEQGLGLAPGVAFGPEGEGYLRWCFASTPAQLEEGVRRLARYILKVQG